MDLVITDDGDDRYVLNQGEGGDGRPDYLSYTFNFNHTGDPIPPISMRQQLGCPTRSPGRVRPCRKQPSATL